MYYNQSNLRLIKNFLKEVRSCYLELIGIGYKIIKTLYSIIFLAITDADHPYLYT